MNENIFSRIWNIASIFRNEGMSDHLYLEQITNLLFLKMIDEQKSSPAYCANDLYNISWPVVSVIEDDEVKYKGECSWQTLSQNDTPNGVKFLSLYTAMLTELGKSDGILKEIYRNSRNEIQQDRTLKQVIENINQMESISANQEALAQVYEELMRRVSENTTSTNGQYFTPRALIDVIVQCVNPQIGSSDNLDENGIPKDWKTVADPCCGTGGFLIAAKNYMTRDKGKADQASVAILLKTSTFHGVEIERATYKLALMNMLLHSIGGFKGDTLPIECKDSLLYSVDNKVDYVLTNPPFGKSGSVKVTVKKTDKKTGEEKTVEENQRENYSLRKNDDFVDTETSSKQLLFVQHIISMLKEGGTAAVVLPDNVLFEGGSGERVRRHLVSRCNLHTILRLPSGIFYAQGIKANVLFFTKMPTSKEECNTPRIWVYDYRAKIHHTLKTNPLKSSDLNDFIKCYNPKNIENRTATYSDENPDGRWRCYEWSEIKDRSDLNFDFKWLKDDDDQYADLSLSELVENYESQLLALNESFKVLKDELLALPNDVISQDDSCNDFSLKSISELQTAIWRRCLSEAISGRLTTRQPSDGTADDLLEQIKAAHREAFATTQKKYKPLTFSPIPDSEIPFEIPENWRWVRLGEIFQHSAGKQLSSSNQQGRLHKYITTSNLYWNKFILDNLKEMYYRDEELERCTAKKGDLLVCEGGDVGRSAIWNYDFDICLQNHVHRLRPLVNGYTEYVYYVLFYLKSSNQIVGKGTAIQGLSANSLKNILIPFPSLSEQLRIVSKLEKLLSALDKRG